MQGPASDRHILDWNEADVHNWLSTLGYPQYESQIREHKIQGDSLCELDSEGLKSFGIASIGRRLSILKSVYLVKVAHNVPIDDTHYVPPSSDRLPTVSLDKLHSIVKDQAQRLRTLEEENQSLSKTLQSFIYQFSQFRFSLPHNQDESSLRRQPSFNWDQFLKPQKSPTKGETVESPYSSPRGAEHDIPGYNRPAAPAASTQNPPTEGKNAVETPSKPGKQESSENLKSFKVSLEDPTWKVLPAALKKYRIHNDRWENYAMFICYGPSGNRIERCLSYDEKPLLLFQKLKDAKKNPVFMLKHIKDIRSPIAVAQQKHAARKASSIISQETSMTTAATLGHKTNSARGNHRPPKLEVQGLSTPIPGTSSQPGWENGLSPGTSHNDGNTLPPPNSASTQASHLTVSTLTHGSSTLAPSTSPSPLQDINRAKPDSDNLEISNKEHSIRDFPTTSDINSYAVAIYPYMAEQDDEFDVVVGDTFIILSRDRGWWVVQRDPTGSGIADPDTAKQGWVPAGCLLETKVPVASAIAEATAAKSSTDNPASKTPILPLSIISTSFPGIALMNYEKKGEEELDLVKDDLLRVFKRYNHWSYAVKETGGDRGWVPSWFIGRVSTTGVMPPTPNTSSNSGPGTSLNLEDNPSPMSSAFPSLHSRSTAPVV